MARSISAPLRHNARLCRARVGEDRGVVAQPDVEVGGNAVAGVVRDCVGEVLQQILAEVVSHGEGGRSRQP